MATKDILLKCRRTDNHDSICEKHMNLIIRNYYRKHCEDYTWILYILIVIFIVTAVSNGANITDGLDGLATGVSRYNWNLSGHICLCQW